MSAVVLVTQPEWAKAEPVFRAATDLACAPAPADEPTLAEAVTARRARCVVVGVAPYGGPVLEALARHGLALLARFGVGCDNVDLERARHLGVVVTNTPGVLDVSVAEHTLWLMGCLARHIARLDGRLRGGTFAAETGIELTGKTLAILGFGRIGRLVARMAHFGLGMRVVAVDVLPPEALEAAANQQFPTLLAAHGVETYHTEAEAGLRQADVLSVHLPAHESTRHFLNATRLGWLPRGALLVNTARGSVVDEAALYDALVDGRLDGAALDVFEHEPYEPVHPEKDLRRLPNVVMTPHVGSNTREANARMAQACLENIRHFLAGRMSELTRVA